MINCIIPLAGPDFILSNGKLKPLSMIDGDPLILRSLCSRNWVKKGELKGENMYFVLRETPYTDGFADFLKKHFNNCNIITISSITSGALLSSLAATSLIRNFDIPLCIDLVDIIYGTDFNPSEFFENHSKVTGIIPYFISSNPKFSYLKMCEHNVIETKEKVVISKFASAGTYFFKDTSIFLKAATSSIQSKNTYKNSYYVCPTYNELIQKGQLIQGYEVNDVIPVSQLFHS